MNRLHVISPEVEIFSFPEVEVLKSPDDDWHELNYTTNAKEAPQMNIKHRIEFQITKCLVFSLVLKEKCPPREERWRCKKGHIKQY